MLNNRDFLWKLHAFAVALGSNFFLVWENTIDTFLQLQYGKYGINAKGEEKLRFRILITAHSIEKALTFRSPRSEFGKEKVRELLSMVQSYRNDDDARRIGVGALNAYLVWGKSTTNGSAFLSWLERELGDVLKCAQYTPSEYSGARSVKLYESDKNQQSAVEFINARYSCRSFAEERISLDTVSRIIELAKRAPSQCNRQSSRAHCYQDRTLISELLKLQGGANGYQDEVRNLFVISSDMNAWSGRRERNQVYVDGALFASGVVSACTAYGVATCCLNLAVSNRLESQIKKVGGIPSNERLIMMIAFGTAARDHLIGARSYRLDTSALLQWH